MSTVEMTGGARETWIGKDEAARRLGTHPKAVGRLIEGGFLTCRKLPFGYPRVLASEVDRLAAESTRPATASR